MFTGEKKFLISISKMWNIVILHLRKKFSEVAVEGLQIADDRAEQKVKDREERMLKKKKKKKRLEVKRLNNKADERKPTMKGKGSKEAVSKEQKSLIAPPKEVFEGGAFLT